MRASELSAKDLEAAVIRANRDSYRQFVGKYDDYDGQGFDACLKAIITADLSTIGSSLVALGSRVRCLDCGGGTGNLAIAMLDRGWEVTAVDVSAEMLDLLEKKARAKSHFLSLAKCSIEEFLQTTREVYDVVGFSSVLHHLYSYTSVVERAASCIRTGGFFYSICDPAPPRYPFWTQVFSSLDIALAKILFDPKDVLPGLWRRIRKLFSRRDPMFGRPVITAGDVAEYHVRAGVDDERILQLLQDCGFAILEHVRFITGRTAAIRSLNRYLRFLESFKIIARHDSCVTTGDIGCKSM